MIDQIEKHLEMRKQIRERGIAHRSRILGFIFDQYPEQRKYVEYCLEELRDVAIILGSARGGTSAFKDTLAANSAIISMTGEHRLFFTLYGYNFPDHGGYLEKNPGTFYSEDHLGLILRNIIYDSNASENWYLSNREIELYGWEWAIRLYLQWPEFEFDSEKVVRIVADRYKKIPGYTQAEIDKFYVDLINAFRKEFYHKISPLYYDFSANILEEYKNDEKTVDFYNSRTIIEISPFVLTCPRKIKQIPARCPLLLLKASSDCYRIPLLRQLFKDRNIYFLHLTRNPLSSANGLIDGWFHPCFGQHDLSFCKDKFNLENTDPGIDRFMWKFDLLEEWQEHFSKPLEVLCIKQWMSSHLNIFRELEKINGNERYCRIPFEDFQKSLDSRAILYKKVCDYLNIEYDSFLRDRIEKPRIINATVKPKVQRWKEKRDLLLSLLKCDGVENLCGALGYETKNFENWL